MEAGLGPNRHPRHQEGVRSATDGEGVDVVLNSLSGDAIPVSLRLLRPFGRFIEIGKRDQYEDTRVGLAPFLDGLTYATAHFDVLMLKHPDRCRKLLEEVWEVLPELPRLPSTSFPISELSKVGSSPRRRPPKRAPPPLSRALSRVGRGGDGTTGLKSQRRKRRHPTPPYSILWGARLWVHVKPPERPREEPPKPTHGADPRRTLCCSASHGVWPPPRAKFPDKCESREVFVPRSRAHPTSHFEARCRRVLVAAAFGRNAHW